MPASFKITLSHKPNSEGLYPVWLRITAQRVPRYAPVGVELTLKQWNPDATLEKENWVRTSHRDHTQLNIDLVQVLVDAKRLGKLHPTATADELKQLFLRRHEPAPAAPANTADFVTFLQHSLETVDLPQFKQATYEARSVVVNKFAQWRSGSPLPFSELTEEAVEQFDIWLKALPNNPTTRRKNLKILRMYVKRAIKLKLLSRDADYVVPTATKSKRVWLTEAELTAYEQVRLPERQHLARLTYLMCFYLHGSRIGAVLRLKWKDRQFGRVSFTMDKGTTEKSVEESPQLAAILNALAPAGGQDPEAYILPWLDPRYEQLSERDALQQMKRGAAAAGIHKKLSTHSSRRTLATEADRANNGDLGKVGALLGHQQRSTTELYIDKHNSASIDQAANNVYQNRPMPLLEAG
jgi:integrase/recombinase XerD